MIVDDSAIMRGFLRRILERDPCIVVSSAASNGADALSQLRGDAPDVVLLDIDMPVMDGMAALPEILKARPATRVIMSSTLTQRNAAISLEALRLGASDYMPKPERAHAADIADIYAGELIAKVKALAMARPPAKRAVAEPPRAARRTDAPEIVAIGSSTGGPPALMRLFEALSGVDVPLLVTQHMPPTFTAMLAEHIGRVSARPSAEAQDGEVLKRGNVYVAPSGSHLTFQRRDGAVRVRLSDGPPENFCRPAVDPMLRSLAEIYGRGVLAVVLTGMGSDGAKGCEAVRRAGGRVVVQDEATSVIWGMPGAVARAGHAEAVLPLDDIAPFIRRIAGSKP